MSIGLHQSCKPAKALIQSFKWVSWVQQVSLQKLHRVGVVCGVRVMGPNMISFQIPGSSPGNTQ